jgi:hypothetical protein
VKGGPHQVPDQAPRGASFRLAFRLRTLFPIESVGKGRWIAHVEGPPNSAVWILEGVGGGPVFEYRRSALPFRGLAPRRVAERDFGPRARHDSGFREA